MIRRDVMKLAETLADASGLNVLAIYDWLMTIGRTIGRNPKFLPYRVSKGRVECEALPNTYVEAYKRPAPAYDEAEADYWEGRILARQEAYMD